MCWGEVLNQQCSTSLNVKINDFNQNYTTIIKMIAILDCHLQAAQPATANLLGHAARP